MIDPYEPRPVAPLGVWSFPGWRFKAYAIVLPGREPDARLVEAARERTREVAAMPSPHATYGVGFTGIHQGRGYNQVFVDRWANGNELLHDVFVSDEASPGALRPAPAGHNSVCVWDLALQAFERDAWIEHAMGERADLEGYLGRVLEGSV